MTEPITCTLPLKYVTCDIECPDLNDLRTVKFVTLVDPEVQAWLDSHGCVIGKIDPMQIMMQQHYELCGLENVIKITVPDVATAVAFRLMWG